MESNLEAAARDGWWFWLHLNLGDQRCLRWLTQNLGLRQGLTAEFTGPSLRQHLSSRGDYLTGHLNDFRQEFDRGCTEHAWLHILMARNFLLTGRVKAVQSAERLRKDLAGGMIFTDSSMLLSHVITNYPDTLDGLHHSLLDELEIVEDHVLDERHRGERKRLMLARREVAQLHRHMRSQRRALINAERTIANFPDGLSPVIARLAHLDQDFEVMEARARFFHDEIDAKLASETNRQLYILSALTAAFLPPTLVAGLFGMNFEGLPWSGSAWGFYIALGLCLLSSAAVWLFLWKASRR